MEYICKQCGKKFYGRKRSDRIVKFCSKRCASLSLIGKPSWNKNKSWTEESRQKISNSLKGHTPWNKGLKGVQKIWNKGLNKSIAPSLARSNNHPPRGNNNPRWKGGVWHTTQGYIHILLPTHPRANCRGYVPQQVLVAEKYLGRHLQKGEIIHHINQDKTDNRPENLFLFANQHLHKKHHKLLAINKEPAKNSNLL